MIHFFKSGENKIYALERDGRFSDSDLKKLSWLFGGAAWVDLDSIPGDYLGPRKEMITPWSTNAVEITQNMGIPDIQRIEEFHAYKAGDRFDRMLQAVYTHPDQQIFHVSHPAEPIHYITDIAAYNETEGLALSPDEVDYLNQLSSHLGRSLTDSEIFGFSQVNSEHCRHKIFNGQFILDGKEMESSLFQMIKETSKRNPNKIVSAYKDNVAFIRGPRIRQFAPVRQDIADYFELREIDSVISLKAETHNFPTTVEPFNGAATGSGGEIRDRMAGGKGSIPLSGSAVYMTSYPRMGERRWEGYVPARKWLYQTPIEILIKASNGASDFGNKFGQPLINGSLLTFEHAEQDKTHAYDKVIMMAGGIGFAKAGDAQKDKPSVGDRIVVMGGDNYRIGMGGGAVSSVATGEYGNQIELNAIQRSNPEMQKRVYNAIRALAESEHNPIVSIHDHGAGGHLNSLSELVEETGGHIDPSKLPVGDPTLSAKEIIGNESQERMGLVIDPENLETLQRIARRERAPIYNVGEISGDQRFRIANPETNECPVDLSLSDLFGKPPRTVLTDTAQPSSFIQIPYKAEKFEEYLRDILQMEAVACKDWLTNKVDRSVTGRVGLQQCAGRIQLPLNNLGISALDYDGRKGIATAIGHAPAAGLIDPGAGSRLSIAEALTNIVWTPIESGLQGISLSANWMWPARQEGEDARLYAAVKAASDFAIALGLNIPTGKDSLSMTQKYPDGSKVYAPGTVIITAVGEVTDLQKTIRPVLQPLAGSQIYYVDFCESPFELGGSSFAQLNGRLGDSTPDVKDASVFLRAFGSVQEALEAGLLLAGHDISAGGMITTLLEMLFADTDSGMDLRLDGPGEQDIIRLLFSEKPGVIVQTHQPQLLESLLHSNRVRYSLLGEVNTARRFTLYHQLRKYELNINLMRDQWYRTSYLLDCLQSGELFALERFRNYKQQPLEYRFPEFSMIQEPVREHNAPKAAIIREKGVNGDREMAYSLYYSGFDVKDIHMTDLISGRETLEDVQMIVFVGGFSNSDVLGSAKGWAGAFLYNDTARKALGNFYAREDTLSLGICNGCQVMVELGLIYPEHEQKISMLHNASGKFESGFITVDIPENTSVMLGSLSGSRLGVWVAHGEGRFSMPLPEEAYTITARYTHSNLPGNPNGSDYQTAAIASADGRHLAMMPHLERSLFPWQWAHYPADRKEDTVSPWIQPFLNAKDWIQSKLRE